MSTKEQFLKLKSYDEYQKNRDMFKSIDYRDHEIAQHIIELLRTTGAPKSDPFAIDGIHEDLKLGK